MTTSWAPESPPATKASEPSGEMSTSRGSPGSTLVKVVAQVAVSTTGTRSAGVPVQSP